MSRSQRKGMHQNYEQKSKSCTKKIEKVKLNSANRQEEHLRQQAEEYELLRNTPMARHLRNLITTEQQKEVHQHIGRFTNKKKASNIKYIDIPIDTTISFDKILKTLSDKDWRRLDQPEDIELCLNIRNSVHLHQVHDTTCTIDPLNTLLGTDSLQNSVTNYYKEPQILKV